MQTLVKRINGAALPTRAFVRPTQLMAAVPRATLRQQSKTFRPLLPTARPEARVVVTRAALQERSADAGTPTNRLFVGNLNWQTTEEDLSEHFESCDGFLNARVARSDGRSRGFGFVEFNTTEQAEVALEDMAETELDGRNLLIRFSTSPPRQQRERRFRPEGDMAPRERREPREIDPSTTLFVGNLPFRVRWQELKDFFNEAGEVQFVDMVMGRDGRPRGFATIRMASPSDAQAAIEQLNGRELEGRPLTVRQYEVRQYETRQDGDRNDDDFLG